jgi:hypothetical protein
MVEPLAAPPLSTRKGHLYHTRTWWVASVYGRGAPCGYPAAGWGRIGSLKSAPMGVTPVAAQIA